jgi:hypothetical protein
MPGRLPHLMGGCESEGRLSLMVEQRLCVPELGVFGRHQLCAGNDSAEIERQIPRRDKLATMGRG